MSSTSVRDQILDTASRLFYAEGVHAVGVDTIIAEAGVAKSSLYRHFRTKDDLIAAYVQSEDDAFWQRWDAISAEHEDARRGLDAILRWIGTKIAQPGCRGCPQLNIVAEFPDVAHPARAVATHHKTELRRRLLDLAQRVGASDAESAADQLWLVLDGAFANHDLLARRDPVEVLLRAAASVVGPASRSEASGSRPRTARR